MEIETSPETHAYQSAQEYNFTLKLKLLFLWQYLKLNVTCILLLIPEACKGIKNIFFPPKPKCIENQVALVTGGGNGIGRAIAFRLAKEKCRLAIVDIDYEAAKKTAKDIAYQFKVSALAFKVDVSKHEEIAQLRNDVESALGSVDILVNNAGLLCMNLSLREGTNEQIQKAIDVNLASHFWVI